VQVKEGDCGPSSVIKKNGPTTNQDHRKKNAPMTNKIEMLRKAVVDSQTKDAKMEILKAQVALLTAQVATKFDP